MKSIFKLSILSLSFLISIAHASTSDEMKLHAKFREIFKFGHKKREHMLSFFYYSVSIV